MDFRLKKDQANDHFARGRFAKCVNLYAELIEEAPRDSQLRLRHAEACRRMGETRLAVGSYQVAAKLLSENGHFARALAALNLALGLAPGDRNLEALTRQVEHLRRMAPSAATRPEAELVRPGHRKAITLEEIPIMPPLPVAAPTVKAAAAREVAAEEIGPQVKRLSDRRLAFKPTPTARWVIISSSAPIDVGFAADGEMERGFSTPSAPLARTKTAEFFAPSAPAAAPQTEAEFELMFVAGDLLE